MDTMSYSESMPDQWDTRIAIVLCGLIWLTWSSIFWPRASNPAILRYSHKLFTVWYLCCFTVHIWLFVSHVYACNQFGLKPYWSVTWTAWLGGWPHVVSEPMDNVLALLRQMLRKAWTVVFGAKPIRPIEPLKRRIQSSTEIPTYTVRQIGPEEEMDDLSKAFRNLTFQASRSRWTEASRSG